MKLIQRVNVFLFPGILVAFIFIAELTYFTALHVAQDNVRLILLAVVIVQALIVFFSFRFLIQRQIVQPINRLVEQVRLSDRNEHIQLAKLSGDDEVAELNNAYLGLICDMQHMAAHDPLTGLANRRSFQHWLSRQLVRADMQGIQMALLYVDLDNFKRVNDHYGHAVGDRVLQQFGEQLLAMLRPTDVVAELSSSRLSDSGFARLAGDEFAVLLTDVSDPWAAEQVAQRILDLFANGFEVDGVSHNVQASIGIVMFPQDGKDAQTLLHHGDAAMYQAKASGKNRSQFFTQHIADEMAQKQHIERMLQQTLDADGFELAYMPIFDTQSLHILGAEVLLRAPVLQQDGIGPEQFIPVAESTGLIKRIDLWVIEQALLGLSTMRQLNGYTGMIAINVSSVELHNEEFPEQVAKLLRQYRIEPSAVELELTETSLVADDASSVSVMQQLKALGVRLSLDDFGTGYTAFNQLASYPVDCLKIDRSFVNDMANSRVNKQPMADIILALARLYNLDCVAEGVETAEQLAYLQQSGCERAQGYYLSKPLNWSGLQALVCDAGLSTIHPRQSA